MKKLTCLLLFFAAAALPQVATKANERYRTKEGRDNVAKVISDPSRNELQRPRDIVAAMGLKPGDVAADIGTGTGFMLPYLSQAVGDKEHVIGEDIQAIFWTRPNPVGAWHRQGPEVAGSNIGRGTHSGCVSSLDYPEAMLSHIRDSLVSNGKLVIVEYYKRPGSMPGGGDPNRPVEHIRLDQDDLIKEMEANGFQLFSKAKLVPKSQHMDVFVKK